jgi:hypothetical protein
MFKRSLFVSLPLCVVAAPALAQPADPVLAQPADPQPPPAGGDQQPVPVPAPVPVPVPVPVPTPAPAPAPAPAPEAKPADKTPAAVKGKTELTFYGFVQLLGIYDTTQGFNEQMQTAAIARPGTYTGNHGQTQISARHSRFGFRIAQPVTNDIKASGQAEMDFLGNQPSNPPATSENAFFQNGTFRFRHFYGKLETPWLDIVAGQWWSAFGWQSYFHPNSVEIQGLPGQVYKRTAQVRLMKTVHAGPDVDVDVMLSAQRPAQRASATPDGVIGAKITYNGLKAWRTRGANDSGLDGLAVGVSALGRRFQVDEFAATPSKLIEKNGYGLSIDALVPIVPATKESHANALTLTGSFATGGAIADQYDGLNFGVSNPNLPNPTMANPAPVYANNSDPGLVMFSSDGMGGFELHPIHVLSYMVGLQYYLPPQGHMWLSLNYTHVESDNAINFGAKSWKNADYFDANLFGDLTPNVRLGASYSHYSETFNVADAQMRTSATNDRVLGTFLLLF